MLPKLCSNIIKLQKDTYSIAVNTIKNIVLRNILTSNNKFIALDKIATNTISLSIRQVLGYS